MGTSKFQDCVWGPSLPDHYGSTRLCAGKVDKFSKNHIKIEPGYRFPVRLSLYVHPCPILFAGVHANCSTLCQYCPLRGTPTSRSTQKKGGRDTNTGRTLKTEKSNWCPIAISMTHKGSGPRSELGAKKKKIREKYIKESELRIGGPGTLHSAYPNRTSSRSKLGWTELRQLNLFAPFPNFHTTMM
jgi:hypothetical protein